jgi:hypothetical protein
MVSVALRTTASTIAMPRLGTVAAGLYLPADWRGQFGTPLSGTRHSYPVDFASRI